MPPAELAAAPSVTPAVAQTAATVPSPSSQSHPASSDAEARGSPAIVGGDAVWDAADGSAAAATGCMRAALHRSCSGGSWAMIGRSHVPLGASPRALSTARVNSREAVGRPVGSCCRHAATSSLNPDEAASAGIGGSECNTRSITLSGAMPAYGAAPRVSSMAVIPNDQMSAAAS
eukprot:jgi/Chrpa1/25684/Chrysochromulina_OHIO_Genome00016284-RA